MGTRADFYVGRGAEARWLGSIAWDGYPDGLPPELLAVTTQAEFEDAVAAFARGRDDWSSPADGWPWPWTDSRMTDFAYAFDDGSVWCSCFGYSWDKAVGWCDVPDDVREKRDGPEKSAVFPDMTKEQRVTFGGRSGLIVVRGGDK